MLLVSPSIIPKGKFSLMKAKIFFSAAQIGYR
jgi:hypothetical protein